MNIPRRSFMAAGAALAALPVPAMAEPKPATAPPAALVVGAMMPLSGPDSLIGDECLRGVRLAVAGRNATGGVAGRQLRLVVADAFIHAQTAQTAGAFMAASRPAFMLGTGSSNFSYPATAAAELAQLPFIEITASADGITGRGFKFLLRTALTSSMIAGVAAGAMAARFGGKKIGLLFNTGATAGAIAAACLGIWQRAQVPVRLSVGYPEDVADLHDPVSRMQRAGVEILLHAAGQDDVLQMFQAAHDVGFKPAAIFGCGDGYGLRATAQALGSALEGTYVAAAPFYPAASQPVAQAYAARFATPPRSADSLTSYVGATQVLDALAQTGGDATRLLDALRRADIQPGTLANGWGVAFDKTGQNSRAFASLQQWRGHNLTAVI